MPNIKNTAPIPGRYLEDLRGEPGEHKNPWAELEQLADNESAYFIDPDGDYKYKQSKAMARFDSLAKQATQAGDTEKADYYTNFMRHTLEQNPVTISREDFNFLSNRGKMHFYKMYGEQAKLMGDDTTYQQCQKYYESLQAEHLPLSKRISFDLSDEKARDILLGSLNIETNGYLPNSNSIYQTFAHQLPKTMEQKPPTGFNDFGLSFFKKQIPNCPNNIHTLRELFTSNLYNSLPSRCIYPQVSKDTTLDEAMGFIHCVNPNKSGRFGGEEKIDCRFYLCPTPDNLVPIMDAFVKASDEANLPYYFKFSTSENRVDKLVIYSNKATAPEHLATLERIQHEHPEWFEGAGKNLLWGDIKGIDGVYFGAEPPRTGKESYGQAKAELIMQALVKWREEFSINIHRNDYEEAVKDENISNAQVKRFKELFTEVCREHGFEPQNFAVVF